MPHILKIKTSLCYKSSVLLKSKGRGTAVFDLIKKVNRLDSALIGIIAAIDLFLSLTLIYSILFAGSLTGDPLIFTLYFLFERGGCIVLDMLILKLCLAKRKELIMLNGSYLLAVFIVLQAVGFIVNIFFYLFSNKNFWVDGYLIMTLEAVMVIVYLHAYLTIHSIKSKAKDECCGH